MNVRSLRKVGLATLVLAMLTALACSDGSSPLEPPPIDDGGDNPPPPPAADYEGYLMYAVDLNNRLLLFGSESPTTISKSMKITGLPILNRIVGIDIRPSTGELYGVGNDSRVYIIDTETGEATGVGSAFSPKIASFFDIHFGMGFDPVTERIRLIAAESGGNWSIDPDDGTATLGPNAHYAVGDVHEGRHPMIMGLAYTPPSGSAMDATALGTAAARLMAMGPCEDLMWAIDAEIAEMIGSCDPDEGDFTSLGPLPGFTAVAGCGELKFDPGQPGGLWLSIVEGANYVNSLGTVDPETGLIKWRGSVPDESPIQAIAFDPNAPFKTASLSVSSGAALSVAPGARDVMAASASGRLQSCTAQ